MVFFSLLHIKASKGRTRMTTVEVSAPVPVITPQPILGLDDDVEMELYPAQHSDQGYPAAASAATNGVVSVNIAFNNDQNPQLLPEATAQPAYGANASRQGCTDVICLPLFIALMTCFVVLSSFVLRQGNPDKLFYGTDKFGNNCGHNQQVKITGLGADPWETRTNIWYPLQFDATSPSSPARIDSERSVGVCVRDCPKAGDTLIAYTRDSASSSPSSSPPGTSLYLVLYDSSPVLNRCMPDVSSLLCSSLASCNSYRVTDPKTKAPSNASISGLAELRNTQSSAGELYHFWWVILISMFLAMVLSYGWMFTLLHIRNKAIAATAGMAVVLFVVGGGLCWMMVINCEDEDDDMSDVWQSGAFTCWSFALLVGFAARHFRKEMMSACDIVGEASKLPVSIPMLGAVPFLSFIIVIPLVVWAVYVALYIQSTSNVVLVPMPSRIVIPQSSNAGGGGQNSNPTASSFELPSWRIPAHLFNVFMFLWVFGILNSVCFMIVAFCTVFWYFSAHGEQKKEAPRNSIQVAIRILAHHHLGTVVFGSFLVTVVQIMRVLQMIAALMDLDMKVSCLKKCTPLRFLVACVERFVEFLDWVMVFISKNAYIMTSIEGSNFLGSARRAASLILSNANEPGGPIMLMSEFFMIFAKMSIAGITTLFALGILKGTSSNSDNDNDALRSGVLIVFCCAMVAYIISALFVNVISVCVDAILMCYYVEKQGNNSPRYVSSALEKIMDDERQKKTTTDNSSHETPLLPSDSNDPNDLVLL